MPRFVLLRHECPPSFGASHWDFMLERDGELLTWRLLTSQAEWAWPVAGSLQATRLANHRLAYLDHEGQVSDNRGTVRRVDAGEYAMVAESPAALRVILHGAHCRGEVALTRLRDDAWRFDLGPPASSPSPP